MIYMKKIVKRRFTFVLNGSQGSTNRNDKMSWILSCLQEYMFFLSQNTRNLNSSYLNTKHTI